METRSSWQHPLPSWAKLMKTFRTGYFFLRHSPIQFKVTAIMTVCWDSGELSSSSPEWSSFSFVAVFAQRLYYGTEPPADEAQARDSGRLAVEP